MSKYRINNSIVSADTWDRFTKVLQNIDSKKAKEIIKDNIVTDDEMNSILDRNGDGKVMHNDFKDYSNSLFGKVKSILKKHSFSGFNLWRSSHLSVEEFKNIPKQFWSDQEFVLFLAEKEPWVVFKYADFYKELPYAKEAMERAVEKEPREALRFADRYKDMPYARVILEKAIGKSVETHDPRALLCLGQYYNDIPSSAKEVVKKVAHRVAEESPGIALEWRSCYSDKPYAKAVIEKALNAVKNEGCAMIVFISEIEDVLEKNNNPLIKRILKIHKSNYSHEEKEKAAILLNEIMLGKITIAQAVKLSKSDGDYFNALRSIQSQPNHICPNSVDVAFNDTSLRMVRQINDLHNANPSLRFKSVQNLKAGDLYTLMVYAEEELFTSSFNGLFDRLLKAIKRERLSGDGLLGKVGHNKFRTFIKLCAGFNRLTEFLKTMDVESRKKLLVEFVSNIDREKDSLSEAVTVADTFSVLRHEEILKVLQQSIKENYERVSKKGDKKSKILYGLLAGLFSKKAVINEAWIKEMSKKYGLTDLTYLRSRELFNPGGINIQQHFFYEDKDGVNSFRSFINHYRRAKGWQVVDRGDYVCIKSGGSNGRKIEIYANKPTKSGEEEGSREIAELFSKRNIQSIVVVHRGHSYHAGKTIERIPTIARIVSLGSCGGYNNLAAVLKKAPKAHIISTKGTGTMSVNDPLFKMLNQEILKGRGVNWPRFWRRATQRFRNKAFNDYVAPHKNLGVMFLKAYQRLNSSTVKQGEAR